jgi:hypothetical protein
MKKLLDLLFGKSVDEQEKDYIKKCGYPKETKVFVDSQGRMSQIIGSDVMLRNCELIDKIFAKKN